MKHLLPIGVLLAASCSFAQFGVRGEIDISGDVGLLASNGTLTSTVGLTLRAHLEAEYTLDAVDLRVTLDPTVRLAGTAIDSALIEPGVSEVFALYRTGDVDVSAGLERLPLETARLSVPFRIEPAGRTGEPQGLLGARAGIFLDDWRVRPAVVYRHQDDKLGGVMGVRRAFGDFELEAHVLYLDGFAAGVGGSGLLGDIVLFGEGWLLTDTDGWEGRGALGLSGFWGDLLWTAEAAYAPGPGGEGAPYPQLLGQFSLPQGDKGSWSLTTGIGLIDSVTTNASALRASGNLSYTHSERDHRLSTGLLVDHSETATLIGFRFGVTSFF